MMSTLAEDRLLHLNRVKWLRWDQSHQNQETHRSTRAKLTFLISGNTFFSNSVAYLLEMRRGRCTTTGSIDHASGARDIAVTAGWGAVFSGKIIS